MPARLLSACFLLAPLLLALPALPQETDAEEASFAAILETLRAKKVTFEYTDAPLKVVIDHIARETGVNFVVDPQVLLDLEAEGRTVNLKLKDLASLDALEILLRFSNLTYTFRDGTLFVTTPDRAVGALTSVTYSVDSLCRRPAEDPGMIRDLFRAFPIQDHPIMVEDDDDYTLCPEDLVDMIRESIAPDTWDMGEYRITSAARILLVSHTKQVHREIRRLLAGIQALQGPAIAYRIQVLRLPAGALHGLAKRPLLTAEEVGSLEKAAAKNERRFSSYRITAVNGARTHIDAGREVLFRRGVDCGEPYRASFRDGVMIDVRPLFTRKARVPTVVRLLLSSSSLSETGLPSMPFLQVNTVAEIPRDGAFLFAAGSDRGAGGKAESGILAVLVQALPDPWPGPDPQKGSPDPAVKALLGKLAGQRIAVDYMDTDLKDVLSDLSRRCGINIIIAPAVFEEFSEDELLVTLPVKDLAVSKILNLALGPLDLAWLIENGTVLVTTQELALASAALRHFPVHDLIFDLPDFEAEKRPFPGVEGGMAPVLFMEDEEEPITADSLVCMVREFISPESWDTPPNQISYREKHLIARNQPAVLDRIEALLAGLREKKYSRVRVEGIVLNAPREWLDKLGLKGPSLSPARCDAVEKALEGEGVRQLDRFIVPGTVGRRFCASGGRQVAYVNHWQSADQFDTDAILDGWTFETLVSQGVGGDRFSVEVSARITAYIPPEDPRTAAGQLASTEFMTDLLIEDGGGALLGSTGGTGPDAEARCLLFLRVRRLK